MRKLITGASGVAAAGALLVGGFFAGGGFESEPKPTEAVVVAAKEIAKNCVDTAVVDVVVEANVELNKGEIGQSHIEALNGGLEAEVRRQAAECFDEFVSTAVANAFESTPVPDLEADLTVRIKG